MVFTMLLKNLWGKLMNNIKKYIKNKDIANITIPLLFPHKKIEINPKIA